MAFLFETRPNPVTTTKKTSIGPNAGEVAEWDAEMNVNPRELFCQFHPGFALWTRSEKFEAQFWPFC